VTYVKISAVKATLYLGAWMNACLYFPHLCMIWVECSVIEQHVMMSRIYEFCENRCRDGFTFLIGADKSTSMCMPLNHVTVSWCLCMTQHSKSFAVLFRYICCLVVSTVCHAQHTVYSLWNHFWKLFLYVVWISTFIYKNEWCQVWGSERDVFWDVTLCNGCLVPCSLIDTTSHARRIGS